MNAKSTWILVALAAGLFAFIYFFERHFDRAPAGPQRILPHLNPEKVTALQVTAAGEAEIRAERTNAIWQLTQPVPYPANSLAIDALLQSLVQLVPLAHVTAGELLARTNLDQEFGFDSPRATIVVHQDGYRNQLQFGKSTPMGDQAFLRVIGVEGIYLVDAELMRFIPSKEDRWRDKTFAQLEGKVFDRLVVTNGSKVIELQRDTASRLWRMTRPMVARADHPKIQSLLQSLAGTGITQFVSDDPRADLAGYGLQPAELSLAVAHGSNMVAAFQFGASPTNNPAAVFARRLSQAGVVLVPGEAIAGWRAPHNEFRDRHLLNLRPEALDEVEVRNDNSFTLTRVTNDTWRVSGSAQFPADSQLVREFLAALNELSVAEFVDVVTELDLPTKGLARPTRQFLLKASNTNGAGNLTNTLVAQIDIGATQENKVFVRRADENSVYTVKLNDLQRLPDAWQLRERRIWNFTTNDVTRITMHIHEKTRPPMVRTGPGKWSVAEGSQGVFDTSFVELLADNLGRLTAAAWTARGEQQRLRYGFNERSPRLTVEVGKGDQTQTLSVEFGGLAPSEFPYAGAAVDGEYTIFEFPLYLYHELQLGLFSAPAPNP